MSISLEIAWELLKMSLKLPGASELIACDQTTNRPLTEPMMTKLTHWPLRCGCNVELMIFKLLSKIDIFNISCQIALKQIIQNLTND